MAENKYAFFKRFRDVNTLRTEITNLQLNKFYNLWMNKFEWNGLDEDLKEQEENYIMRKLWADGKVAVRNIRGTDMIALCPFAESKINIYDFPEEITLVNKRGASTRIIPNTPQRVNKDVAIIYAQPNRKPIEAFVRYYAERIAQVELVINTNLSLQKMPYLIGVTDEDRDRAQDVINRILNDEVVVFTSFGDLTRFQAVATEAPYIIDKLKTYEVSLENELLTFFGIDNSGNVKAAQMNVDETNAENSVINSYGKSIEDEIKRWVDRANKVLNRNITLESKEKIVDSVHDTELAGSEPIEGGDTNE